MGEKVSRSVVLRLIKSRRASFSISIFSKNIEKKGFWGDGEIISQEKGLKLNCFCLINIILYFLNFKRAKRPIFIPEWERLFTPSYKVRAFVHSQAMGRF